MCLLLLTAVLYFLVGIFAPRSSGAHCADYQFQCSNSSRCISRTKFCNGFSNCGPNDSSDETDYDPEKHAEEGIPCRSRKYLKRMCLLPKDQIMKNITICNPDTECKPGEFMCSSTGRCFDKIYYCNGRWGCGLGDLSDEILYNDTLHSEKDGIPCRGWKYLSRVCLLPADQVSRKDEICNLGVNCGDSYFTCPEERGCLDRDNICDKSNDCGLEYPSDELVYDADLHNESIGVPCRNKYNKKRICLLPRDQAHKNETLCSKSTGCAEDTFQCSETGRCMHRFAFCTGKSGCTSGDESDGIPYNETIHTEEDGIACRSWENVKRVCLLPIDQVHKEKVICNPTLSCQKGEFACPDGECLFGYQFCDGNPQCQLLPGSTYSADEIPLNANATGMPCQGLNKKSCLLPFDSVCDGFADCVDGSDECFCNDDGVREENLYLNEKCFKCFDGSKTIRQEQLCDNVINCRDLSDECLCLHKREDPIRPICKWIYFDEAISDNIACISRANLCDGSFDCKDNVDEKYCEKAPDYECSETPQPGKSLCDFTCPITGKRTKKCDGRFTCEDYKAEECLPECEPFPHACGLSWCAKSVPGVGTFARTILSKEICNGFKECLECGCDEFECPHRFACHNADPINIPDEKKCDLKPDCQDSSDELECEENTINNCNISSTNQTVNCYLTHFYCGDDGETKYIDRAKKVCDGNEDCASGDDECQDCTDKVFSSDDFMISTQPLIPFLWIISISAVIGNIVVIFYTVWNLFTKWKKMSAIEKSQNILVLNLSTADLLVGIYTAGICIENILLSKNRYCRVDQEWRSGRTCSAFGVILLIGSEESVFALTIITAFRLISIIRPFSKISARTVLMTLGISWIFSILLATLPLYEILDDYFVESIWYDNNALVSSINREQLGEFTKNFMKMHNISSGFVDENGGFGSWQLLVSLIKILNPGNVPARRFGYYSTHGVCLPKLFPDPAKDEAWGYSIAIIVINFFSFLFIFGGYGTIYFKTRKSEERVTGDATRTARLQKKVTRIVVTDFLCWMPICIMGFIQLSGVKIPTDVYVPVGTILIPINSAVNPFLYSNCLNWIQAKLTPVGRYVLAALMRLRRSTGNSVTNSREGGTVCTVETTTEKDT